MVPNMTGWSASSLIREAVLNVFSPGRGIWLVSTTLITGSLLGGLSVATCATFERDLDQQIDAGRNTVEFAGISEGRLEIDRTSCESLTEAPDVESAGALVAGERSSFTQLGDSVRVAFASRSLIPELRRSDAVVGSALLPSDGRLQLLSDRFGVLTATVGSERETALGLASTVLLPLEPDVQRIATCTVQLERYADVGSTTARLAGQLTSTAPEIASQPRLAQPFDLVAQYRSRPDRLLFAAAGLIGGLVFALRYQLRSSELAAYRFSGTSRKDLMLLIMTEQFCLSGLFTLAGCIVVWILPSGDATASLTSWALLGGAVWWMIATIATTPVVRARPTSLAKDR
jgi:hypothetical protein